MTFASNRAESWSKPLHDAAVAAPENLFARHVLFSLLVIIFYFVLSQPQIILVSPDLGFTAWYPAVGLVLAVMLCVSPRYVPLLIFADILTGMALYHQPLFSWDEGVGALVASGSYFLAALALRGPFRIDSTLRHRRDVVRYVSVVALAAIVATLGGVTCLVEDGTIERSQFWASAVQWYMGDMVGLVGFAPFLLIHVFPWIQRQLGITPASAVAGKAAKKKNERREYFSEVGEAVAQVAAIVVVIWIMLGQTFGARQFYFLGFVPIIWIAMRHGIKRVATALVLFNFGIVLALRIFPHPVDFQVKLGLLMLAVSATGLLVGSEVTERKRITRQLGDRTGFLNSLIEQNPLAIAVRDHSGKVQFCNDALSHLFLYSHEEIVGRDLDSLIGLPGPEISRSAGSDLSRRIVRKARKDKTILDLELQEVDIALEGDSVSYAIYRDISDQVKSARESREHAESLDKLVTELQLRTVEMSQLNDMVGLLQCCSNSLEAAGIVAKSAKNILSAATGGALYLFNAAKDSLVAGSYWGSPISTEPHFFSRDCWALRRGQPYWSEHPKEGMICAHLLDPVEASYLCVPMVAQGESLGILHVQYNRSEAAKASEDFESLQQSQQRLAIAVAGQVALSLASLRLRETLREQSIRDPLTNLFNRRFMMESLDREIVRAKRRQHPLSVIFVDLDHFKSFNDTFGHEAGDEVLKVVAEQLRTSFRADDVVCRYGGEEFAVLLPEANATEAAKRADHLREAIRKLKVTHRDRPLGTITISVGVAGYPEHAPTATDLLRLADLGLYRAKSQGRDRVIVVAPSDAA